MLQSYCYLLVRSRKQLVGVEAIEEAHPIHCPLRGLASQQCVAGRRKR